MKAQRCQRTPFQLMRPTVGSSPLMAATRKSLEAELRAAVQGHVRLVGNACEANVASLDDGEICRALLPGAPGTRTGRISTMGRSRSTGKETGPAMEE